MDGQHETDALSADVDSLQKDLAKLYERSRKPAAESSKQTGRGDQSTRSEMQLSHRRNL